jgi:HK97 family phage prohead protease
MFTKLATAEIKAVGPGESTDLDEGQFEAIVSVFNVVDSYGDVVMPGAFKDSLTEWEAKGMPVPIIWSHQWTDIWSHIGHAVKAEETEVGLKVRGQLDLENPTAAQTYKLLKQGRIGQFSFGFEVKEAAWGTRKSEDGSEQDVYELRKLGLYEVGPCLVGVNPQTELLAVKGQPPTKISPERKGDPGSATPVPVRGALAWATVKEAQEDES